jgi:hypothetical protein
MLSEKVPDKINCKDKQGRKHGWWIYYKIHYNPMIIPDVLDAGNYISTYRYGKYEHGKLVGIWKEINNVHLIYEVRVDTHYYSKNKLKVGTWTPTESFATDYIGDSAIMEYEKQLSKIDTASRY